MSVMVISCGWVFMEGFATGGAVFLGCLDGCICGCRFVGSCLTGGVARLHESNWRERELEGSLPTVIVCNTDRVQLE